MYEYVQGDADIDIDIDIDARSLTAAVVLLPSRLSMECPPIGWSMHSSAWSVDGWMDGSITAKCVRVFFLFCFTCVIVSQCENGRNEWSACTWLHEYCTVLHAAMHAQLRFIGN